MARLLPTSPLEYCGVFTTKMANAAGWTPAALINAVEQDRVTRLARGAYVASELLDGSAPEDIRRQMKIRTIAACLSVTGAASSHTSAAILDGLPTWTVPERPCITVLPRFTGDSRCAHLHRATTPPDHLRVKGDPFARTISARTVLDTAREHGVDDAVVMGDYALRHGLVDPDQLWRVADHCDRWPGIRRARQVIDLLDPRSESPLESVSRLRMLFTHLPQPELQPRIYDLNGRFLGRPDFYWDEFGVAGEVDGKLKYATDPRDAVWREKRRQEPMEDTGLIFVRWGRPDLDVMALLVRRIETVFARGAGRPRADRAWLARYTPKQAVTLPRQCR